LTAAELNKSLLKCVDREECHATKLYPSSDPPVRIDPVGQATGILLIFLGEASAHLAKLAELAATSQQFQFSVPLTSLCSYILELQKPETKLHMVYFSGLAVVWMPQVGPLVMTVTMFGTIRADVDAQREAEKRAGALQKSC
jgi:hypothetical protein